jgi:F-type H+-transporting ATPase subunit b
MPPLLELNLLEIASQAISFFLLVIVLKRFAWKPLLGVLDQRRARIEADLARASEQRAECERLLQEVNRRLAKIEEEARAKIQESVLEGKRIGLEVQEEARAQAHAIVTKARETVELDLAKARVVLRDQVAGMTLAAVERILQQKIDAQADRRLVDQVLHELEQAGKSA